MSKDTESIKQRKGASGEGVDLSEATQEVALAEMAKFTAAIYRAFVAEGLSIPEAIQLTMAIIGQGAQSGFNEMDILGD